MVFSGVPSSELQFGGLREGGGTREAGSTVAESLVVSSLSGGYAPDSVKAEGSSIVDEPGEG